jgi:hypothetical protein
MCGMTVVIWQDVMTKGTRRKAVCVCKYVTPVSGAIRGT